MIRWKYILPRVAIFLAIGIVVVLASRPLVKWAIVHSGQSITGAKVEVGDVRLSLWKGQVELSHIEMADPRDPQKNLIQAKDAVIHLDPRRLLHREFVVDEATISNLQFGTPRAISGALVESNEGLDDAHFVKAVNEQLESLGDQWLNQVSDRIPVVLESQLESYGVVRDLKHKWPTKYEQLRDHSMQIQNHINQFESSAKSLSDNPLRDLPKYQELLQQLQALKIEVENVRRRLHLLGDEFGQDRQRLVQAKTRDEQKITQIINNKDLVDEQMVSQLLLGQKTATHLEEVLAWVQWFRNTIPDPEKDFSPSRARGYDVQFRQRPNLVFRKIQLDGQGRLAGQNFHFFGQAHDLSTNPKLYANPTRIHLRGNASTEIIIDAILDRRGPQRIDQFKVSCPGLEMPQMALGNESDIKVEVGESLMALELDIKLVDDLITGELVLRHHDTSMSVAKLNEKIGGNETLIALNQSLAPVNQFTTRVSIQGEIQHPKIQLSSDLGPKFSASIESAVQQAFNRALADQSERISQNIDEQFAELNREFSLNVNEILGILDDQTPVIGRLEGLIPNLKYLNRIR